MKQIHNDAQRDTWGQKEEKAKTRRQEFLFLLLLSLQVFLGLFPYLFPPSSPFGTYLICSVRPEPSMVLAPHRCSFSEMSFYRRQHSAVSDGKRRAKLRGHTADTHAPPPRPPVPCISCFLQSAALLRPLSTPILPDPHGNIEAVSSETFLSVLHPSNFLL